MTVHVQRVGTCPNGHAQYRIGRRSNWLEHIVPANEPDVLHCHYATEWSPLA